MSDEKQKNDSRQVEWSFDFANLNESFQNLVNSLAGEEEVETSEFAVSKAGVQNARIKVDYSIGKGSLKALDVANPNLFEATVKHVGELTFRSEGDVEKHLELKQKTKIQANLNPIKQGLRAIAQRDDLEWQVGLAPNIPLSLDIDGGIGPVEIDLTGLEVRKLEVDGGVGTLHLTLPAQDAKLVAEVDNGVGQSHIVIPQNADIILDIDGGVGSIEVILPADAAIQIKADGGIGSVNVPRSIPRLSKREFMESGGVWQSEGFDLAERRIVIHYDGGVGALNVRLMGQ